MKNKYNQTRSFNLGLALDFDIPTALLFDELSFWGDKGSREDGWVYKSYEDLQERLPLSEYQLRESYKKLEEAGIVEKKIMKAQGVPMVHFRILKNLSMGSEIISVSETEEIKDSIYIQQLTSATNITSNEVIASAEPQLDSGSSEIQELVYEPLEENQPRYKSKFKKSGGFGNKEVSTLLALGKKFGFTTGKLENYAVARLVKRYGFSDVKDRLEKSQKLRRVAFAPQITSMMDLEKKWAKLDDYLVQNDSSGVPKSVMDEIKADTEKYKQMDVPQNEIDDIIEKRIKRYKESGDWR